MHLLIPLLGSLLFVCSLILVKRASAAVADEQGEKTTGKDSRDVEEDHLSPLTTLFFANMFAALIFSAFWGLGGTIPGWTSLHQPFVVAVLYCVGLGITFLAISHGDVSIATPVLGVKVILVAILLAVTGTEDLPASMFVAAALASLGIALIQWTSRGHRHHVLLTIVLAVVAATMFAYCDLVIQRWAPAWGTGRFLPIAFWFVGLLSLPLIPAVQWSLLRRREVAVWLLPGACLMAMQAVCITFTLAIFGDAARVNVVYALRGMWAVGLAWLAGKIWGGGEAELTRTEIWQRLAGATLLTTAVIVAILVR